MIRIAPPDGWARAGLAGIEAALIGWGLVMVLALVGYSGVSSNPWLGKATWSDAMDIGGDVWAAVLGASVSAGGVTYRAVPTLVTLLVVLMLRALMIPGRRFPGSAQWTAVPTFAATSLALIAGTSAHVSVVGSLPGAIIVPALAAAWASVGGSRAATEAVKTSGAERPPSAGKSPSSESSPLARTLSGWSARVSWLWDGLRQARACLVVVVVVSAVAMAGAVASSWDAIRDVQALLLAGATDTWVISIAQVLFLPSAMAWALSWLAGPGFLVGTDTVHSPTAAPVAPIPALPALGAIPTNAPGNVVVLVLVALGLVVGAWIAWRHRATSLRVQALAGVVCLVAILVIVAAWTWVSTLSLGTGRMAVLGPRLIWTPIFVTLEVGVVAELVALVTHPTSLALFRSGVGALVASGHEAAGRLLEVRENARARADDSSELESEAPTDIPSDSLGSTSSGKAGTLHGGTDDPTEQIDVSEADTGAGADREVSSDTDSDGSTEIP